jgi:transcriptional regulator with XRE-family HTH domain
VTGTESVADRIAFARSQKNISQPELARRLGMNNSTQISQWEKNVRTPRPERLSQIAAALGVSVEWLISGTGERPGRAPAAEPREHAGMNGTNGSGMVPEQLTDKLLEMRPIITAISVARALYAGAELQDHLRPLKAKLYEAVRRWRPSESDEDVRGIVDALADEPPPPSSGTARISPRRTADAR